LKIDADRIDNTNAASLLQSGEAAIRAGDSRFDLSTVKRLDSSAVALLLAWQRVAHARGLNLELEGVPASLCSLATLYGVNSLISCPPSQQSKPAISSSAIPA
jgi:phospholipid transport system transporter-binding protein